jgi:dCMP deaminase
MNKWDQRYLDLAKYISTWSKDPSTKCGSVITDKYNRIISTGFNGFPQGIQDDARLKDRDTKYEMIVHAEQNSILFAKQDLHGCSIYTWPYQPCSVCAAVIVQAGIQRVVSPQISAKRWEASFKLANDMFKEANIETTYIGQNS